MLHTIKYNGSEIAKNIEICTSLAGKALGLMFRKKIPDDYAMIFVFKKTTSIGIHMLFMRFPIDVVFLNEDKKIAGFAHLSPWTGHKAMKNVKYVIETNHGAIEKHKLSVGGQMEFGDA